jgi:DNA-binding CsgD family transcriptional regulator
MNALHNSTAPWAGSLPWDLLDFVDYPMVLVVDGRRVAHANRAARLPMGVATAHSYVCARLVDGSEGLVSACLAAQRGLRSLLRLQFTGEPRVRLTAVLPVDGGGDRPAAVVMFERPALCQPLSLYGFGRAMGLTDAEVRVLNELWEGNSPQQIATSRQVALSTVRTQLGQIRSKTGSQSVGAVIRQIATLPPILEAIEAQPAVTV